MAVIRHVYYWRLLISFSDLLIQKLKQAIMIHFLQQRIARRFRAVLCGDASGNPPWIAAVAAGGGVIFIELLGALRALEFMALAGNGQ